MTWAEGLYQLYTGFGRLPKLPNEIEWLFPQQQEEVQRVMQEFFTKYFSDSSERTLMLGINPGRFGAGVTGVNFTAPRQLQQECGIFHPFKNQSEISAEFIYELINAYGGPKPFYSRFFIGSVSPLGFVQRGKNINYYDDRELLKKVEPFIIKNLKQVLTLPVNRESCLCIGGEKNYKYLRGLNERFGWFKEIVPLPHPRFIMQYRRASKEQFVQLYLQFMQK